MDDHSKGLSKELVGSLPQNTSLEGKDLPDDWVRWG